MTREIKFRAWDVNREEMVAVDHLTWGYGFVDSGDLSEVNNEMPEWFELMQYTGLKDKNGVEIYEGDIVKTKEGYIQEIVWLTKETGFACREYLFTSSEDNDFALAGDDEVIGNIYETPELLQGEEL